MASADQHARVAEQSSDLPLAERLVNEWARALAGDPEAQAAWQIGEGGEWIWQSDGLGAQGKGTEWSGLSWRSCDTPTIKGLKNFVIEVTISGKAAAAGLSFGPYKDFLAELDPRMGCRHLQLEVDVTAGGWGFRVDGQLMTRCWWDSAVRSIEDLVNGTLTLKARGLEQALFQSLAIHTFQASCGLSVIITCYRFLQRLRITLHNWCHQSLSSGAYEVLVVNPQSPDGTHEHLAAVANSYPHVRVREVVVGLDLATNKGAMINRAVKASRGEWIWLTDADCLFSPMCAAAAMGHIQGRPQRLFYGQRRYLTTSQTDELLSGRTDGLREFEVLSQCVNPRPPENAPWGYTQIVHRSTFERARYPEHLNHFAHSDGMFVEECKRRQIVPEQVDGLFCLHLEHPFAWYGTSIFL